MTIIDSYSNNREKKTTSKRIYLIILVITLSGLIYTTLYPHNEKVDDSDEIAWMTLTQLPTSFSPKVNIINITSKDLKQIPKVMDAIDDQLLEEITPKKDHEQIGKLIILSKSEIKSILNYFDKEYVEDKKTYEFYISFAETNYSILIQLGKPPTVS